MQMLGNILNHHWNGNISLMSNDDGRELIALKKNCLKFIINQASWFQPFVTKLSCSSFLYWPTGAQTSSPFHLTQLGQKVPVEAQRESTFPHILANTKYYQYFKMVPVWGVKKCYPIIYNMLYPWRSMRWIISYAYYLYFHFCDLPINLCHNI